MEVNEIALLINRVSYFLGLREPLDKTVLKLQAEFLKSNFQTITPSVFKHAFELASAQELNVETEFFGNWTPQYMGRILNAYKQKMGEVEIKVRQATEKITAEKEVYLKAEMFDMKIALSEMLFNAYVEWKDLPKDKSGLSWVYLWQLRHIGECLDKYTDIKPENVLREAWKKDEDSTIELFSRIFASIESWQDVELTRQGFAVWLSPFYLNQKSK